MPDVSELSRLRSHSGIRMLPALFLLCLLPLSGPVPAQDLGAPIFHEASAELGLDFRHFNGMVGEFYFPEMTGQGGALLDYDGDGDLDLFLRQGDLLRTTDEPQDAVFEPPSRSGDRLFRNDQGGAKGPAWGMRLVDVTESTGLRDTGYAMGVAVGDYDGDGALDLYLTNYGENQMWRNRGDGSFENTTLRTATQDSRWSTSAAFLDFDNDGNLDLFSTNYVEFDVEKNPKCFSTSSARDYCGPSAFRSQPDRLWRNRGDGTFEDVSVRSEIGRARGAGLGVVTGDFNGDGLTDLYVANDGEPNHLWLNQGNGTFSEDALFAGAALNRHGSPEASMGLAAADYDGDGKEDLFLTHLAEESNTFYRSLGQGLFEDRSRETRLAAPSMPYTGFGVAAIDFDNDGWPDLAIANGAVKVLLDLAEKGDRFPLAQQNQLFRNRGRGTFEDVSKPAGGAFTEARVGRGLVSGDLDQDGADDLLLLNNNGPAQIFLNRGAGAAAWIGIAGLAPGAEVRISTDSGRTLHRVARADGSYCSARDLRVLAGLGSGKPTRVETTLGTRRLRLVEPPERRYLVLYDPSRS